MAGLKRLDTGALVKDYEGPDKEITIAYQMAVSEVTFEDERYIVCLPSCDLADTRNNPLHLFMKSSLMAKKSFSSVKWLMVLLPRSLLQKETNSPSTLLYV
jgi:hypothetical protein